jgi:hypothetical protein
VWVVGLMCGLAGQGIEGETVLEKIVAVQKKVAGPLGPGESEKGEVHSAWGVCW